MSDTPPATPDPRERRRALRRLERGAELDEVFLVHKADLRENRGNRYLALVLGDAAGRINARLWDATDADREAFAPGKPVWITALVERYHNRPQLIVRQFGPPDTAHPARPGELTPGPDRDPQVLRLELLELLGTVRDEWLRQLCDRYTDDDDFMHRFCAAPAGTSYHHAWPGGLLEHTLKAMQIGDTLCVHYPDINRDLVLVALMLHDSGKVEEMEPVGEGAFRYTATGNLVGHITIGVSMLDRRLATLPGFPPLLADELRHCIVAHHGFLERGSPRQPMTPEALVVHHVECLDSELATFANETAAALPDPDGKPLFEWSNRFQRRIMLKPQSDGEDPH